MKFRLFTIYSFLGIALIRHSASAFDPLDKSNVVNYWGQNTVSYTGGSESDLIEHCKDNTATVFALAFVNQIQNGLPIMNLSKHCSQTYPGTSILRCPKIGEDIKSCQAQGKAIVVSIGGASGSYSLPDAASGRAFAEQMWDMFLGGSSSTRPFGDAIVDGIDLDLESGQNSGYVAFIETLRSKFTSSSKGRRYYITAAPQCPYPDIATKDALESSWFDLVWVQFYNNVCGVHNYGSQHFNFDTWNNWATTVSVNKDVRILLGVPGGPGAAGTGVIDASRLTTIVNGVKAYSNFGGVMMWDAGVARSSGLSSTAIKVLGQSLSSSPSSLSSWPPSSPSSSSFRSSSTRPASPSPTARRGKGGPNYCSSSRH